MLWWPIHVQLAVPDTVEVLWTPPQPHNVVERIDIVVEQADALLHLDSWDPVTSMSLANAFLLRRGEAYNDQGLRIRGPVHFTNAHPGEAPLIRGILWGR